MIKRILIKNWKSHGNTEIMFTEGTNVIIGKNGAGKSSILEAIYFSLYGVLPEGRSKIETILRYGSNEGQITLELEMEEKMIRITRSFSKGKTRAELRINGVLRYTKSKDIAAYISEITGMDPTTFLDVVYAKQNTIDNILTMRKGERKERLDKLLQLEDFEKIRKTAINVKNTVKRKLDESESSKKIESDLRMLEEDLRSEKERREKLKKEEEKTVKEIEVLEKNIESAKKEREDVEKKVKEYRKLKDKLLSTASRIKVLEEKAEKLKKYAVENPEEEIKKTKRRLEEAKLAVEKKYRLNTELAKISTALKEKKRELEGLDVKENVEDILARLLEEREKLEKEIKSITEIKEKKTEEVYKIDSKIRTLNEKIKENTDKAREIKELSDRLPGLEEKRRRLEREIQELENAVEEHTALAKLVRSKGMEKCPICGRELSDEKRLQIEEKIRKTGTEALINTLHAKKKEYDSLAYEIEIMKSKIESARIEDTEAAVSELKLLKDEKYRIETEKKKIETQLSELQEKWRKLMDEIAKIEVMAEKKRRARELIEEITALEKKRETIQNMLESLPKFDDQTIDNLRERVSFLEKSIELKNITIELKTLKQEKESLERRCSEYHNVEEKYVRVERRIAELKSEIKALNERIGDIKKMIENCSKIIKMLEEKRENLELALNTRKKYEKLYDNLQKFEKTVKVVQEIVRERRIAAINRVLNMMWGVIYPYGDIEGILIKPTLDDYIVEIKKKRGGSTTVDQLSGGERSLVALSIRIALSSLIGKEFGVLFLDEPTHNLDTSSTETLAELLRKIPDEGLFKQVILITHNDELQRAATKQIIHVDRNKEEDGITKITVLSV